VDFLSESNDQVVLSSEGNPPPKAAAKAPGFGGEFLANLCCAVILWSGNPHLVQAAHDSGIVALALAICCL